MHFVNIIANIVWPKFGLKGISQFHLAQAWTWSPAKLYAWTRLSQTSIPHYSKSLNHAHFIPNNQGMHKNNRKQQIQTQMWMWYKVHVQQTSEVHRAKHSNTSISQMKIKLFLEDLGPINDWKRFLYVQQEMRSGLFPQIHVPTH